LICDVRSQTCRHSRDGAGDEGRYRIGDGPKERNAIESRSKEIPIGEGIRVIGMTSYLRLERERGWRRRGAGRTACRHNRAMERDRF